MDFYESAWFPWSFVGLLLIGYLLVLVTSPAASAMRYAVLALCRHFRLVALVLALAFAAALTRTAARAWFIWQENPDMTRDLVRELFGFTFTPAPWLPALETALQPALQNSIGIYHCALTTFPLSIPAALLFLLNRGGVLRAIFGHFWRRHHLLALPSQVFILLAAVAALAKPAVLWPGDWFPADPGWLVFREVLLWLAFGFEYAFGVFIQVALAMRVFEWLRGMHFEDERFLLTISRRFVVLWPWLLTLFLLSSLLFYLPPILAVAGGDTPATGLAPWQDWLFVGLLLPFAPVQVLLIFHNHSLPRAVAQSLHFLRTHPGTLIWMTLLAFLHWYAFEVGLAWVAASLGDRNVYAAGVRLAGSLGVGLLTCWLFATWITLFKQVETGHEKERAWLQV